MTYSFISAEAYTLPINRRLFVSSAMMLATALTSQPALADDILSGPTHTVVSDGGFRYIPDPGSPFSKGVAALGGHTLTRVRFRTPLPLEQGLDYITRHLAGQGRPSSALAGLELRAPAVMSRPEFINFNEHYREMLRKRGFVIGQVVPMTRSNMVLLYNPPMTHMLSSFTYAAPSHARSASGGTDFLLSGRPEQDGSRVIAPGDVSPLGMSRKAGFVMDQLRQSVATLGGHWSDLTGVQIYMTQPLQMVMDVMRTIGLTSVGLSLFPGSPPVIGFDGAKYEFEADIRAISVELAI